METMNRRECIIRTLGVGAAISALQFASTRPSQAFPRPTKNAISLATWSLVKSFRAGTIKLTDVPAICRKDFGIDGIEHVNQFFENPIESYLKRLNKAAADSGVQNVLIMVDDEGDMIAKDKKTRMQSAINHRKWVEIAAYLGCHAIRCNARGGGKSLADDPDSLDRAAEAFGDLIEYARAFKINVVIENHGGLSSDPEWLPALCKKINSPDFGILPDYGNYGEVTAEKRRDAVKMAMPFAKGVSVKAGWLSNHTHPGYDLAELLKVSMDSGYTGFWGIESGIREATATSPDEIKKNDWQSVLWTKEVIEKVVFGKA
jgi:sugar phosphate isomerase/epimerase